MPGSKVAFPEKLIPKVHSHVARSYICCKCQKNNIRKIEIKQSARVKDIMGQAIF
jgi:hypothetical protein